MDTLLFDLFESTSNEFFNKFQPFFFRSGVFIKNLEFVPSTSNFIFEKKSGIINNFDNILFFEQTDSYFISLIKKFFLINFEKNYNLNLWLFDEKKINYFFVFKSINFFLF